MFFQINSNYSPCNNSNSDHCHYVGAYKYQAFDQLSDMFYIHLLNSDCVSDPVLVTWIHELNRVDVILGESYPLAKETKEHTRKLIKQRYFFYRKNLLNDSSFFFFF